MAVNCGSKCFAYVCEWGAHQVTRVDLASGEKVGVGAISSPSGCAVDAAAGYAYAVQQVRSPPSARPSQRSDSRRRARQGERDGQLLRIPLTPSGERLVMAKALVAPMGVAVGGGYVYVGERGANRVRRIRLSDGQGAAEVWAAGFNSPIGLAAC